MILDAGHGSTVSQPSLVARMVDHLFLTGSEAVLDVGAGTGYQTALLSRLARTVDSVEHNPRLSLIAERRLAKLGCINATVHTGDGALGVPDKKFDAIIVAAGARDIPKALKEQLNEGGRIVVPVGRDLMDLLLILGIKSHGIMLTSVIDKVRFVPLVSPEHGGFSLEALDHIQAVKARYLKRYLEQRGQDIEEFRQEVANNDRIPLEEVVLERVIQNLRVPDRLFDFISAELAAEKEELRIIQAQQMGHIAPQYAASAI